MNNTLSIIMPALNEENNIADAVCNALKSMVKHNIEGEVIVVNDGSTDSTRKRVEELVVKNPAVRLINHDFPCGIGFSFWDGMKNSVKDVVVMFPGDNENDPDDAMEFYKLMDLVDIVVPFIHNAEMRDKKRRLISSLYRFILNMSFGVSLNYTNGTVFYRRAVLHDIKLKSHGFFYQGELLIRLIRKGYLFAEVPNYLMVRKGGKSKATTLKSLLAVIKDYLGLMFDIHILRIEAREGYRRISSDSMTYLKKNDFDRKTKNLNRGSAR